MRDSCNMYVCCMLRWPYDNTIKTKKRFIVGVKCDCIYQVVLAFLGLLPAILGTITIPVAVVQLLGAAATIVPDTHLLLPRLLGLWGLAVSKNAKHHNRNQQSLKSRGVFSLEEFLLACTNHRWSCLTFSVGPPMRFLKNSSLFFCMISS